MGKSSRKNSTLSPSPRSDVAHLPLDREETVGSRPACALSRIWLCRWRTANIYLTLQMAHNIRLAVHLNYIYIIIILSLHVIDRPVAPSLYLRLLWWSAVYIVSQIFNTNIVSLEYLKVLSRQQRHWQSKRSSWTVARFSGSTLHSHPGSASTTWYPPLSTRIYFFVLSLSTQFYFFVLFSKCLI